MDDFRRKVSIGGNNIKDEKCMHYQIGTKVEFDGNQFTVEKIKKNGKLFFEKGKSEWDIYIKNVETKEEFLWKTISAGDNNHFTEERFINFI